jgi:hypothetical protein
MKCPINAWLLPFTLVVAISFVSASGQRINGGANPSPTITSAEASNLINLLPVVEELRAKGMDVSSDLRAVPDMNNTGYYFFWVYNKTAQKQGEIASISVGNYGRVAQPLKSSAQNMRRVPRPCVFCKGGYALLV